MLSMAVYMYAFWALLATCCFLRFSRCQNETVLLDPSGDVAVCPNESPTFTCRTTGGPLLWETMVSTGTVNKLIDETSSTNSSNLGIFRLSVGDVRTEESAVVEVDSTATTLNGIRPEDDNTTLSCLLATTFIREDATLKLAGPPPAPVVTSITLIQSGINNSSLLISWSMSDCAVQYVVTINSSDGSVYLNITTSDTNTTVTLPNGVEYCVTVVAIDAIGRRGQDSTPSCYDSPLTTIETTSTFSFVEPTSTGTMSPIIDLTVIIVVPVVTLTGIIVVVVIVMIAVIIVCIKRRSKRSQSIELEQTDLELQLSKGYICQVFIQNMGENTWSFTIAISHVKHWNKVEKYYKEKTYYKSCDFQLEPDVTGVILTISNLSDGWKGNLDQPFEVSRTAVKWYNGVGEPPHCEMTVEATEDDVTPPDLCFDVNVNGKHIRIKEGFEVQNDKECSVQVFYYYVNINWWQVIVAFFPTDQHEQVEQIYQDANTSPSSHQPLNFCGGNVSIIANNAPGWCIFKPDDHEHQQVKTAAIERYKCDKDGKPPYCELTLKAVSDDETPPDLSLAVTLFGANKTPKTILLNRVAMTLGGVPRPVPPASNDGKSTAAGKYACQVFYYREGINHWRATFAFFPEEKTERVKEFFQNANIGPTTPFTLPLLSFGVKPDSIDQKSKENGWQVIGPTDKKIDKNKIKTYNGEDKPPNFEIVIKPMPEKTILSDFCQSIKITGINTADKNTIVLERALDEIEVVPLANAVDSSDDVTTDADSDD